MKKMLRRQEGFTLLELIVVIIAVIILAIVIASTYHVI
jgi:type II secretory pathway pseudopilin PulG